MAGERKNSNQANSKKHTNRTTGKRKATGSKKVHNQKNDVNRELFRNEIVLMVTLVISLLLILSNFNLSGKVGGIINGFTFGLFGFIAYLLPFILFFGIAFFIANRGNSIAFRKLISSISLGVVLTAFIQMITLGYNSETQIIDYYLDSSEQKNGGGLIGGLICKLLHPLFGTVGTFIILIALIFIFIMFITGKALLTYLGIKSEASIQQIKERRAQQEEEYNNQLDEGKVNRRPARTVLLKKSPGDVQEKGLENGDSELVNTDGEKNKSVNKTDSSLKGHEEKGNDDGFLNLLKKKKSKNTVNETEKNPGSNFDMEEILPIDIDNIPIHRAGNNYDDAQGANKTSTYEEQLKSKFGQGKEENHTSHVNPERPGIDADIERLLQAAGRDSLEEAGTEYFEDSNRNLNENVNSHDNVNLSETVSLNANMNFSANSGTNSDLDSIYNDNINSNINSHLDNNGSNFIDSHIEGGSSQTLTEPFYSSQAGANTQSQMNLSASDVNEFNMNQRIEEKKEYVFPPLDLLSKPKADVKGMTDRDLKETAVKLQKTLESFGVRVTVTNVSCGPAVTRYELQPEQGVKVSRITGLADDIKLNLAAADVRIEAPIPGKAAVGIEVPNKENSAVMFRELIESKDFKKHPSDIAFAVGKDIGGQTIVTDIGKMPHLLIAGATGSGKSVCINTLIMSILYKAKPSDVKMIMVDPKVVELSVYNGIPHLLIPVVTDPKKASAALNWAVMEMTERYKKFADLGVRDVKGYNEKIATVEEYQDERYQKLPQIVIIVDELADLMMVAPGEVEDAICRLAQMARAAGLHLIIATQRPSVNVITGLIKANIPSRIAFSVSSAIDSRTIIDGSGAEKLLGKGDMLFFPSGYPKPIRVQGAFISDKEVGAVVEFLTSSNSTAEYNEEIANKITSVQVTDGGGGSSANERDDYFIEAGKFIIDKDKASIGMLQRVYKIGFNRAARIMDQLAEAGVVGPEEGTKPRKILMSLEEFEQYVDEYI